MEREQTERDDFTDKEDCYGCQVNDPQEHRLLMGHEQMEREHEQMD